MAEEKIAAPVAEDTAGMPEGDAPFKSSVVMDEGMDKPAETEEAGEDIIEEDASDASSESSTDTNADENEPEDDVKQILKKADKQDNVQKRFDQLTARLKALEEENASLKNGKPTEQSKEIEYTDAQLRTAAKKAMEDGDSDLLMEIMDYRVKKSEKDLIKRYQDAERQRAEHAQRTDAEWNQVRVDYANAWAGEDMKTEIYPGAKRDLDITSADSTLYRVAKDLYSKRDEQGSYIYRVPGGQRMAVADALAAILRHRKIAPQSGKVKQLERTLAKEKRKKSLAGSGSMEEDVKIPKLKSGQETLAEVIAERKKFQNERGK